MAHKGAPASVLARTPAKDAGWRTLAANNVLRLQEWFSLNTKREHCEMISIADCLNPNESDSSLYKSCYGSRFPVGCYEQENRKFTARGRTQFLSPLVTYAVNLVLKLSTWKAVKHHKTNLRYKLEGKTETSSPYLAYAREDGFHMVELYHLTSSCKTVHFEIVFYASKNSTMLLEGIEFCPLEKVEYQLSEDEKVDMQPISDSDAYWEEKLPNDYQDIIKRSKDIGEWRTKQELYKTLSKGFLINDGQEWFYLDKNGKQCVMLSAASVILRYYGTSSTSWSLLESRFGGVVIIKHYGYKIIGEIKAEVVSPQTTYASYLVFKLPEDEDLSNFEGPVDVMEREMEFDEWKEDDCWHMYYISPKIPFIRRKVDVNIFQNNPAVNRPKIKGMGFPQQRSDGWMEVQIWEFQTGTTTQVIPMYLKFSSPNSVKGLVIQGIEFRPI